MNLLEIAEECFEGIDMPHHCCYCHKIYDEDWHRPLIDLKVLMGDVKGLPGEFIKYNITSGACPPCYHDAMSEFAEKTNYNKKTTSVIDGHGIIRGDYSQSKQKASGEYNGKS